VVKVSRLALEGQYDDAHQLPWKLRAGVHAAINFAANVFAGPLLGANCGGQCRLLRVVKALSH